MAKRLVVCNSAPVAPTATGEAPKTGWLNRLAEVGRFLIGSINDEEALAMARADAEKQATKTQQPAQPCEPQSEPPFEPPCEPQIDLTKFLGHPKETEIVNAIDRLNQLFRALHDPTKAKDIRLKIDATTVSQGKMIGTLMATTDANDSIEQFFAKYLKILGISDYATLAELILTMDAEFTAKGIYSL